MAVNPNYVYLLRDTNQELVDTWKKTFAGYPDSIKISHGDIFSGAPAVDALVVPSNSFGFLDGAVGMACVSHFGTQIQTRLHNQIQENYDGELLVGQATIIPTFDELPNYKDWSKFNEGALIKYLIAAPTMRVPLTVSETPNTYLAFRAVILAVNDFNRRYFEHPIKKILVPGLGTKSGNMPSSRCAHQMLQAYETFVLEKNLFRKKPGHLQEVSNDHEKLCKH